MLAHQYSTEGITLILKLYKRKSSKDVEGTFARSPLPSLNYVIILFLRSQHILVK